MRPLCHLRNCFGSGSSSWLSASKMISISLIKEPIFTCPICLDDCSSGFILDCSHRLCYSCFDYQVYLKDYVYELDHKYDFQCCTCRQYTNLSCDDVGSSAYRRNLKHIGQKEIPAVINSNNDDIHTIIHNSFLNIQTAEDLYSGDETEEPSDGIEEMDDSDDSDYSPEEDSLWEQFDD